MNDEYTNNAIITMQHHLDAADKYLTELGNGYRSPEKQNTLLDAAMKQVELCCIDMRNLCEKIRPSIRVPHGRCYNHKEIYGTVTQLDNGWLDIRLNALLPNCRMIGGTQYIFDTVTRLLDGYRNRGGILPCYEKAYMAIAEHCPMERAGTFDNDNKGFRGVINALKGRAFRDDNQFELALGMFTVIDEDICCHIYVLPFDEAGDFHYQMSSKML